MEEMILQILPRFAVVGVEPKGSHVSQRKRSSNGTACRRLDAPDARRTRRRDAQVAAELVVNIVSWPGLWCTCCSNTGSRTLLNYLMNIFHNNYRV